jgi:AcrR family transcriptional regulator
MFRKEQVVRVALNLVERNGHEALSMRGIAAELGTGVATLYNYFGSLAELNDALAITLLNEIPLVDANDARETRRQLEEMVIAYANVVARHPNFVQMVGALAHQQTMRIFDSTLQAMLNAGVDVERAAVSWSVLSGLAESHATSNRRVDRVRQGGIRTKFKELDALQAVANTGVFKLSHDEWFRKALSLTIDQMLPELKAKSSSAKKADAP